MAHPWRGGSPHCGSGASAGANRLAVSGVVEDGAGAAKKPVGKKSVGKNTTSGPAQQHDARESERCDGRPLRSLACRDLSQMATGTLTLNVAKVSEGPNYNAHAPHPWPWVVHFVEERLSINGVTSGAAVTLLSLDRDPDDRDFWALCFSHGEGVHMEKVRMRLKNCGSCHKTHLTWRVMIDGNRYMLYFTGDERQHGEWNKVRAWNKGKTKYLRLETKYLSNECRMDKGTPRLHAYVDEDPNPGINGQFQGQFSQTQHGKFVQTQHNIHLPDEAYTENELSGDDEALDSPNGWPKAAAHQDQAKAAPLFCTVAARLGMHADMLPVYAPQWSVSSDWGRSGPAPAEDQGHQWGPAPGATSRSMGAPPTGMRVHDCVPQGPSCVCTLTGTECTNYRDWPPGAAPVQ